MTYQVTSLHKTSKDTSRATANFWAIETVQSPRFSISCIVRLGTPENSAKAGTERFLLILISFSCIQTKSSKKHLIKNDY